ncbi:kinase-like protein [Agrocybe pediades]|nr:kinase-like protein [Agrocybe pediades]
MYDEQLFLDDCGFQEAYCREITQTQFNATISAVYSVFVSILRNRDQSAVVFNSKGDVAQHFIDLMQMLLDYPKADNTAKNSLLSAILRLSESSGLHPRCFTLKCVKLGETMEAAGAFGDIWKGELQGQQVCLKIIRTYKDNWLKAFLREAILWGQISHPNILPFYGVYHLDDERRRLCLVSSWMNHGNLNEYLCQYPDANRLSLVSDVAFGLTYLHERNIVHGDLKGANILVTDSGRACLSDFGLSSVGSPDLFTPLTPRSSSFLRGTTRWQAPELLSPDVEDPRVTTESDVYAYGCVLYEVYTGKVPFYEFHRDFVVIVQVLEGRKPTRPQALPSFKSQFGFTESENMWEIMESCWDREPSRRPTMTQIIQSIRALGIEIDATSPANEWDWSVASRFRNAIYRSDGLSLEVLETVLSWVRQFTIFIPRRYDSTH